jgi:chemotaxis methyl-accepting protein methylase
VTNMRLSEEIARPPGPQARTRWARTRWIGRVFWNVVTRAEISKTYLDRIIPLVWNALPARVRSSKPAHALGRLVHRRVCRTQERVAANYYTRFFRNRPQLDVLRDAIGDRPLPEPLRIVSLGCSSGAELYSVLWTVRTARPDLRVQALGLDISEAHVRKAIAGEYPLDSKEVAGISATTYDRLFTQERDTLRVQDWLREGITWRVGNVCSPDLPEALGLHDVVLANNFLFHMPPERSVMCLRNIARVVAPGGYLFIWGVDRDVRLEVIREMGLTPVAARLADIHTADESALQAWPLLYWGVEPMSRQRRDWPIRYTTVFRAPEAARHGREARRPEVAWF